MAGYTRQSIADIINGSEVTAPPLNAEFNQVAAAFAAATGHSHDGSTGNAPKIDLATSVTGYLPAVHGGIGGKNNFAATTNPLATDDAGDGYAPGSMWENTTTGRVFICVGNTSNAAVWRELVQVQTANKIIPETTDTVDLGDPSTRFQDLWLSGGLSAFGNGSLGGTLTVTGATALSSTLAVTGDATFANLTATGTSTLTSVDVNSGAIDSTAIGTTTPAAGTFTTLNANTSLVAATADINGGTIDGATIGASTPSTGAFTTISTSGQATLASADINGGSIDGATVGATSHTSGKFTTLQSTGQATLATADINGGAIDGTTIGTTTPSSGAFTTVSASGGVTGDLTGDVTGNVTGNITGAVTGNVTGNLTGNVTSTGSSSFNNVTIDGTLNMNANTTATITNLSAPTNDNDAARKIDVDNAVANLVDSAPGTLDTLNELAAALGDDADFSTTITNSIATKLPLAGGTMTGAIAMSTNKITGVGDPTAAQDVSSKAYTDQQDALQVTKSGDSMSGNLAMGSNNITGLATPTANDHAVNKSYADNILGSSTAAATSAANAATSESNAATSETNASNSASAAATSEANAAASYDNFDDRYLGAKSTAPTVDNDGDALIVGALYFNSTTNIMNVYGSGGWQSAGSAVNGTSDRNTYTATAGQTVFAATYDTGYVDVYLNGVKLIAGTDFTATNGTSITLTTGAAVNDVVDIVAYGTFVLADHYTKLQSDARYVEVAGDTMTGNLDVTGTVTADGLTVDGTADVNGDLEVGAGGAGTKLLKINGSASSTSVMDIEMQGGGTGNPTSILRHTSSTKDFSLLTGNSGLELTRLSVTEGGDISFYEDTGTTPKMVWKSADERLGIGTSLPSEALHIRNTLGGENGAILIESFAPNIKFNDLSSPVPDYQILVNGGFNIKRDAAGDGTFEVTDFSIDSSGHLLVGQSSTNTPGVGNTTNGHSLRSDGLFFSSAYQGRTGTFGRNGNDGPVLGIYKDGANAGDFGAKLASGQSRLYLGNSNTKLLFDNGADRIYPVNNDGNARNAAIDLGLNGAAFKDLYLSGGVYLGGTGAANKLDDYEEGTWNVTDGSGAGLTFSISHNRYTKIGRFAMAHIRCQWPTTSSTALARLYLPFAADGNSDNSTTGGVVTEQNYDGSVAITACINESDRVLFRTNGITALTNAQLSGKLLRFTVTYFTP